MYQFCILLGVGVVSFSIAGLITLAFLDSASLGLCLSLFVGIVLLGIASDLGRS